jgi:hypothetical protein
MPVTHVALPVSTVTTATTTTNTLLGAITLGVSLVATVVALHGGTLDTLVTRLGHEFGHVRFNV